jgi:hypothetical protein
VELLTQDQTAEPLRLSGRTLERHRVAGTGPRFVRLRRRILYRREHIDEWITLCTRHSTSDAAVGNATAPLSADSSGGAPRMAMPQGPIGAGATGAGGPVVQSTGPRHRSAAQ